MVTVVRKILVYLGYFLAVVAFVILASYAVLLASGYKINWQERSVVKTGIIAISTTPTKAKVFLNNKMQTRLAPLSIKYLRPGEYDLRIEKENYLPYRTRVKVEEGLVSDQRNLTLFWEEPLKEEVEVPLEVKALAAFGQNKILLQDKTGGIFIYDQKEAKSLIENLPRSLLNFSLTQALLSPSEKTAVLLFEQGKTKKHLLWQEGSAPRLFEKEPLDFYLDGDSQLISLVQDTIQLETLKNQEKKTLLKGAWGVLFADNKLYAVKKNEQGVPAVIELSLKDGEIERAVIDELPTGNYFHLFKFGDSFFINAQTPHTSTLWFYASKNGGTLERLIGDFTGSVWEMGKYFVYQSQNELFALEKDTLEQVQITHLLTPVELVSSFKRNLFFLQGSALRTIDYLGGGLGTLVNLEKPSYFIDSEAKKLYTVTQEGLVHYELREE